MLVLVIVMVDVVVLLMMVLMLMLMLMLMMVLVVVDNDNFVGDCNLLKLSQPKLNCFSELAHPRHHPTSSPPVPHSIHSSSSSRLGFSLLSLVETEWVCVSESVFFRLNWDFFRSCAYFFFASTVVLDSLILF
ncbi:hypothetical protein DFH28DRAFT_961294 [Melampsora americana]|nr:hypothetical protein DFH28DRAFT_961294 [Melampsora americana]